MKSGTIVLVGGYGHVGTFLARALAPRYPGRVVIAGRNLARAERLAATLPGEVRSRMIDVEQEGSIEQAVQDAGVIVNCSIDQRRPVLLQAAGAHAASYLDIGASAPAIAAMLECSAEAAQHGTCAVVAAGLDPGCTNIMAARAAARAGRAHTINVALLLSSSDAFGNAAIDYMLEAFASPTKVNYRGQHRVLSAYREHRWCEFPSPFGKKRVYRFPFPEQVFFAETLQAQQASNWYAMESAALNGLLSVSARLGVLRILRHPPMRAIIRQLFQAFSHLPGSNDALCALAEVQGSGGTWQLSLTGHQESRTTALCALPLIQALYEQKLDRPGVWLPEQVIDPSEYFRALSDLGLEIQIVPKA